MKYRINNLFVLNNETTVLAVLDFNESNSIHEDIWSVWKNGVCFQKVRIKQILILSNQSKKLNETAIELFGEISLDDLEKHLYELVKEVEL